MGDLKPVGSEKLQGQEKIKRILEIARYKENKPSNLNETNSVEYKIDVVDGNNYQIVKEKLGYIIKRTISESQSDYIEPIKNRKYYQSYSQALKRLNLMIKEMNALYGNNEGLSLFGEQKKFYLKTPKDDMTSEPSMAPALPSSPPPVPSTELPPSDLEVSAAPPSEDTPPPPPSEEPDMGGIEDMGGESEPEEPTPAGPEGSDKGEVTFKTIQKFTGKLTQKIRELENSTGLTSEQIKYVINMLLSSVNLENLNDEDRDDIMTKFEGDEDELGDDNESDEVEPTEPESEVPESPKGSEMSMEKEMGESNGHIFDSIFSESKIDKVLSKYFEISDKEKKQNILNESDRRKKIKFLVNKKMKSVKNLSETFEQEMASKKFLEENHNFSFLGKTNKKNLIFEFKGKQVKVTPKGLVK